MSSTGKIAVGERWGYFTGRRTPSEEGRRMTKCKCSLSHSRLLGVSVICWKGQHYLVFGPFQQIKAIRKKTRVKLTEGKQPIWCSYVFPQFSYREFGLPLFTF